MRPGEYFWGFHVSNSRDKELAAELGRMVQEKDDTCCCVITVERSFCAPSHEEKDKE